MITRPDGLIVIPWKVRFNILDFSLMEIDMNHVNRGKSGSRKNNLTLDEVLKIAHSLINHETLLPSGTEDFDQDRCSYFVKKDFFDGKEYKIVFCICSDRPSTIGVITLFRVR